jgi:anti-sigma factor RsiW
MRCPGDEDLLAFLSGKLAPKKRASVEAHVDGCNVCRLLVIALAKTVTLGEDTIPPTPRVSAPR